MATSPAPLDSRLEALREAWPAAQWEKRYAEALARSVVIEAVVGAIAAGMSEGQALEWVGQGLDRSTFRRQRERFITEGVAGLFSQRRPPPRRPLKATPAAEQIICAMRLADPQVAVERIAEVLAERFNTVLSTTVIKRVLAKEDLNRPVGGVQIPKPAVGVEQVFAGAEFLRLADEALGYTAAMTEVIVTTARQVAEAAPTSGERVVSSGRNRQGHFTAASNQAHRKGDAKLGPAFRAVEVKRREVDLKDRRLATEAPATVMSKVQAALALPYLTDTGKWVQVDTHRAAAGLAEACGTGYVGSTLDRFFRDAKYLGLGQPLVDFHARFWQANEPASQTPAAALCLYLDGSNKPLWTEKFTRCGKVSANGRVMPCLEQALVHTGMGTPLYWETFSGHESLVKHALPLLAKTEALVGADWMVGKILVIDGEGAALDLLRAFDTAKRGYVTILREGQVSRPELVRDLTAWAPYRDGDDIAEGTFTLAAKSKAPYDARVVLLRRKRAGHLTVLVTNVLPETLDMHEIANAYFDRWPKQELRFRTFSQGAHFKRVHGYGKQLVTNISVVTELDKLAAQSKRLDHQRKALEQTLATARKAQQKARRVVQMAAARRTLNDRRVAFELSAKRPDPKTVAARVKGGHAERDRGAEAQENLRLAEARVAQLEAEQIALQEKDAELATRVTTLETRRTIYQADTELDTIMTAFKLGFVLVSEAALRLYFGGKRLSLDAFTRYILSTPGTKVTDKKRVTIRFKPSPNKEIQAALVAACERVNAMNHSRDGKLFRMEVEELPDRKQRSKVNS